MKEKKVSIIVVNWNGKQFLKDCLLSLKRIDYSNYEVVVVDNASTDGSQTYVKRFYSWVRLIEAKENLGYVGGNNLGIAKTNGEYIFILNNDVKVEKSCLMILVKRLESDAKIVCVQPKLCEYKNRKLLDSAGSYWTDSGFLYHYGRLKKADLPIYNRPMEIYSAKGAAMLLKRKIINQVGGAFDADFFIYFEETDLCHRLWLSGYKVIYEPKAVIYHVVAGDTSREFSSSWTLYLSLRNRLCSFIKNFELINLIKILLITSMIYFLLALVYLLTFKFSLVKAIFAAVWWNFRNLRSTLEKRGFIQNRLRKKSDNQLFNKLKLKINPPILYYYYLFRNRLGDFKDIKIS